MTDTPWTDEAFTGVELGIDEWDAYAKIIEREGNIDRGLSRYRELVEMGRAAWTAKREFEKRVAHRTVQLVAAGVYPDAMAPAALQDHDRKKISRTDAAAIAEAEVLAGWPTEDPRSLLEQVRSEVHMVQHHLKGRDSQMSGAQTFANAMAKGVYGGARG